MRFLAAFMVIVVHAYEAWCGNFGNVSASWGGTYAAPAGIGLWVDQFIRNLGIGVDVFFLLSGFLITFLLLEEKKRHGKVNVGKFMIRRAFRIWPVYYLIMLLAPLLISWLGTKEDPHYLATALFVNNFSSMQSEEWAYPFSHFWSICVEEHFYLLWPFLIGFVPVRRLPYIFAGLILLSVGFRIYAATTITYPWYTLYLHTLSRMDVLVLGSLGGYLYHVKPFEIRFPGWVRVALWVALLLALGLTQVVLWDSVFAAAFKKYLYLAIIAALMLDYNFNPNYPHRLRQGSIVHYLGKTSYGIYMYGNVLLLIVMRKVMGVGDFDSFLWFMGIIAGLSVLVPILSYEFIEKPILRYKNRYSVVKTGQQEEKSPFAITL